MLFWVGIVIGVLLCIAWLCFLTFLLAHVIGFGYELQKLQPGAAEVESPPISPPRSSLRSSSPSDQALRKPGPFIFPRLRKKVLVLDLDETLVHTATKMPPRYDFHLKVQYDQEWGTYYVIKRPHVDQFMQKVCQWYHVVIFTAGIQEYANPVIDLLDPEGGVEARYFRENCVIRRGNYTKDLRGLHLDLSQTIIIDNQPSSYELNPTNAIPIDHFLGQMPDTSLLVLLPLLDTLRYVLDVRSILSLRLAE